MKTLILACLGLLWAGAASAELPAYSGKHINDLGHLLTPEQDAALERKVMDIENTIADRPQVMVLLIDQLPDDETIDTYKNKVFHAWGIGQKGLDNGVLLVIAKQNRKVGFEIGYGAEARITDAASQSITDTYVKPNLTRGAENWYKATDEAIGAIGRDLAKSADSVTPAKQNQPAAMVVAAVVFLVLAGAVLAVVVRHRAGRKRERLLEEARSARQAERAADLASRARSYPSVAPRGSNTSRVAAGVAAGVVAGAALSEAERSARERRRSDSSPASTSSDSSSSYNSPSSSSSYDSGSSSGGGGDSGGGGSSDSF